MTHVIREDSPARTAWDVAILALIVATCVLIPYQVAFQHRVNVAGSVFVYAIDLFFLFDIFLNFRTSYRHRGLDVTDRSQITSRYLRTFFTIDLIAVLPLDALVLGWSGATPGGVALALLLRLLRLVRIVRLFVVFHRWERQSWTNSGYLRIARLFTVRVFAVPGRPVIRHCPPTKAVISSCSTTASWPTMTLPSSSRTRCITSRNSATWPSV